MPSKSAQPDFLEKMSNVIPAGKGMKDVQLLVVDRENRNRICELGEIGEIYVRAGGLAEGYLGNDELNKAKFVNNWFVDNSKWVEADRAMAKPLVEEPWREFYKVKGYFHSIRVVDCYINYPSGPKRSHVSKRRSWTLYVHRRR